jgi:uncharacterized protein YjlB
MSWCPLARSGEPYSDNKKRCFSLAKHWNQEVAVLPAGKGHCRPEANRGFLVVGAYPHGQEWDICRQAPDAEMLARMASLLFPSSDPVWDAEGVLPTLWGK